MNNKRKILIVDDDVPTREMYGEIFGKAGYEVIEAEDGELGLNKAITEHPDIVFTGIVMPKMDGFMLVEALKKNEATAKIPIAICSHLGREKDLQRGRELGVNDFIVRDMVSPRETLDRINGLFTAKSFEGDIKFDTNALDAAQIAENAGINKNFQCSKCSGGMVLHLKQMNSQPGTFEARFICPKCDR